MAHRHSVASRNVAVGVLCTFFAFMFFLGMVQVSNQVNGLRSRISVLQDQQDYLEANGASLLAEWTKATRSEIITGRAKRELGLQLPGTPALVLLRNGDDRGRSSWQSLFQSFSQGSANAAEVPGNADMGHTTLPVSP